VVETELGQVLAAAPEVNASVVAPEPAETLGIGVDLQEKVPVGGAGLEEFAARVLVATSIGHSLAEGRRVIQHVELSAA
jgi:hypothetical protein